MSHIVEWATYCLSFAKQNPILGGAISLWGLGVLSWLARYAPATIKSVFVKQFTVNMAIESADDMSLYMFIDWFEKQKYCKKVRTLRLQDRNNTTPKIIYIEDDEDDEDTKDAPILSAGYGKHYFWIGCRPFMMERHRRDENNQSWQTKETITIYTVGRSQESLRRLVKTVIDANKKESFTKVYEWSNSWDYQFEQESRSVDTIFLGSKKKSLILGTIDKFLASEKYYLMHGIPYHLGIMLCGISGSGKTSMVRAICTYLKRNLYMVDISSIGGKEICKAFARVPKNGIILIEDMDSYEESGKKKETSGNGQPTEMTMKISPINTSNLSNALDGASSTNGRIVVMTTNHMDKIDPILLRPGRADLCVEFGYMEQDAVREMIQSLYGHAVPDGTLFRDDIVAADLQNMILVHRDDPEYVMSKIRRVQ